MNNKNYIPSLTWLRAIAAFFVVVSHAIRTVEGSWTIHTEGLAEFFTQKIWYARLFDLGTFGVYLFFALSGFTLYLSNRKMLLRWSDLPTFYVKRLARIWPAFLVSVGIYTLFALLLWPHYSVPEKGWMSGNFILPETIREWANYLFMVFDITGPPGKFVGPYWSLPIEFHYYLMMAPVVVLMARLPRLRFLLPLVVGTILVSLGRFELVHIADTTILNMALSFFLGIVLSDLYASEKLPAIKEEWGAWTIVLFAFITISALWQGFLPVWMEWPSYIIFPPLTIYAFLNIKVKNENAIFARLMSKYGTYSYSIYLFHMLSYGSMAIIAALFKIELNESLFWPVFLLGAVSSYAMAALSYRFIEVPSIDLGRKASEWLSRKNLGQSTP